MTARCAVCATAFEAKRSDARYCSATCRQKALRSGERVHGANVTGPHSDRSTSPNAQPAPPDAEPEAAPQRVRAAAMPAYEAHRARVYAAGSLHGPVYDAKGNQVPSPEPEIVGHLGADGRLERLERGRKAAATAAV